MEGEGELLLASHRGFHKPSPPEPLLEMKVGGLSSLPLRILDALQLNPAEAGTSLRYQRKRPWSLPLETRYTRAKM